MPLLRVIRDRHANPTDRMTWAGFDVDGWTHEFCGTVPQPWADYRQYERLEELDGADLYDVADLMYPWAQEAVERWPGKCVATIWENIPFNYWSPAAARMLAGVRAFIPRSQMAAECIATYGIERERIHIVPAAVDTTLFRPLAERRLSGGRRVLYVGRLTWEKGLMDLAYACRGQEWRVALAGDGPMREWAESVYGPARGYDGPWLEGVLGQLEHGPGLVALMNAADIVVMPSISTPTWIEQFGVVSIEAMACGTPIVTSDSGAFREIVPTVHMSYRYDHGFVPFFPAGRWDLLRDTVNTILGEAKLWRECSRRCEDRARHEFGHEAIGARLREVYGQYVP